MTSDDDQSRYFCDPFKPTVEDQTAREAEFIIPWTTRCIPLGTGFDVGAKKDAANGSPLPNAFETDDTTCKLEFFDNFTASMREIVTSSRSETGEHQMFALSIEANVCGGLASATGKGQYDHHVQKNSDVGVHSNSRIHLATRSR
jgi:hypothetical protein